MNFEHKLTSYIRAIFDSEFTIRELAMISSVSFSAIPIGTSCPRSKIKYDLYDWLGNWVDKWNAYPVQRCCLIFLCPEPQTGQPLTRTLPPTFAKKCVILWFRKIMHDDDSSILLTTWLVGVTCSHLPCTLICCCCDICTCLTSSCILV